MKYVQFKYRLDEARELHLALELLDALTNTALDDPKTPVHPTIKRALDVVQAPFTKLRESLDKVMHHEV